MRKETYYVQLEKNVLKLFERLFCLFKVVYIYRNPKDEMVSWFKFLQGLPSANVEPYKSMLEGGWNKYFEHTIAGIVLFLTNTPNQDLKLAEAISYLVLC